MSPNPQHDTPAGEATLAIQRMARQTGGDVQELQTLYVLEAFLARVAVSAHRDDFILKGGVLLAAFVARRPTKDLDLQATGLANDAQQVAARMRDIATLQLPDGVAFDPDSITARVIRDEDRYAGVRVKLVGGLGRARLTVGIDVNFGDPIWPEPALVSLPRVVPLGQPPVTMLGYPLTMVLAEKIVTALDRGEANTRWRDFADVYTLTRIHDVHATELRASLEVVARYREVELSPLLPELAMMPVRAQPKWRAWRGRCTVSATYHWSSSTCWRRSPSSQTRSSAGQHQDLGTRRQRPGVDSRPPRRPAQIKPLTTRTSGESFDQHASAEYVESLVVTYR